jgi:carboxylesterase
MGVRSVRRLGIAFSLTRRRPEGGPAVPVLPGAEPFQHDGSNEIGVLLCHGFTGTPQSMRPWGDALADAGFGVSCPLLPGHGTDPKDANRTGWPDWYGTVEAEFERLRERYPAVFVFGLSMGGTLTLRLAEQLGDEIAGIVLVNPSVITLRKDAKLLPVLSKVFATWSGITGDIAKPGMVEVGYSRIPLKAAASLSDLWQVVRADLAKVTQPTLLLRSRVDNVVEPINAKIILETIGSQDVREVELARSNHVATLDYDAELIFSESIEFAKRVAK